MPSNICIYDDLISSISSQFPKFPVSLVISALVAPFTNMGQL